MPKARTLDNDFWDDPETAGLSREERLLLIGMITICADDHGRLLAHPAYLRKHVFGYDEDVTVEMVTQWRNAVLAHCRNVLPYSVNGHEYIWLRRFEERQKIRWKVESKLPEPTEESIVTTEERGRTRQNAAENRSCSVGLGSVDLSSVEVEKGSVDSSPAKNAGGRKLTEQEQDALSGSASDQKQLWERARRELEAVMNPASFKTWIRPIRAGPQVDGKFNLLVPDEEVKDWLENRLRSTIGKTLDGVAGHPVDFEFRVRAVAERMALPEWRET